jgi:predicted nucleic acid-binding protein
MPLAARGDGRRERELVVVDTSVLLNFLRVGRLDLLLELPDHEFLVTDHVRREVTDQQNARVLDAALNDQRLREERVDAPDELEAFGRLATVRTLGVGECAALAVAVCRQLPIAIDDKAARKKAKAMYGFDRFVGTADLVVAAIRGGLVDVVAADLMKLRWEVELRFRMGFGSFAELV